MGGVFRCISAQNAARPAGAVSPSRNMAINSMLGAAKTLTRPAAWGPPTPESLALWQHKAQVKINRSDSHELIGD